MTEKNCFFIYPKLLLFICVYYIVITVIKIVYITLLSLLLSKSKCVLNAFTYVCDLNFRVKITLYCIKIGFLHLNVYNVIFTRKTKSHTCEKAFITCSGE